MQDVALAADDFLAGVVAGTSSEAPFGSSIRGLAIDDGRRPTASRAAASRTDVERVLDACERAVQRRH